MLRAGGGGSGEGGGSQLVVNCSDFVIEKR